MKLSLFNIIMHIIMYLIPNVRQQLRLLVFSARPKMNVQTWTFLYLPSLLGTDCTSFCTQRYKLRDGWDGLCKCQQQIPSFLSQTHRCPSLHEPCTCFLVVWQKKGFLVEEEHTSRRGATSAGLCFRSVFSKHKHTVGRARSNKSLKTSKVITLKNLLWLCTHFLTLLALVNQVLDQLGKIRLLH